MLSGYQELLVRLVDIDTFERADSVYLDERAHPIPCAMVRPRRNHNVGSRLEFVARSIHRETKWAREYSDVLVVPVPVEWNRHLADSAKSEDKASVMGWVPVKDCPFCSLSHPLPCQIFHAHSLPHPPKKCAEKLAYLPPMISVSLVLDTASIF